MTDAELAVLLLVAAAGVAVAARRARLPEALGLLGLGLALGATGHVRTVAPSADLILLVFLPPLLFEAAFVLPLGRLWRVWRPVLVLAGPGILLAALAGGLVVRAGLGLDWSVALLFGAIVAATDPVAVLAVIRRLGVGERLATTVEGESLLNDGVALVAVAVLRQVARGEPARFGVVGDFALAVGVGTGVGLAAAWLGRRLIALADDHLAETSVSLGVAYGAFLAADRFYGSGVLATLIAAAALGHLWRTGSQSFTEAAHHLLAELWALLAFLANAAIFVLIGLEVQTAGLARHPWPVAVGIAAALAGRAAVAYGLGALLTRTGESLGRAERHLLFWGGLRGAVALAAALGLPADVPHRAQLLAMTYGAVLFTTLAQGLTVGPLVRRLGLGNAPDR